MKKIFIAALAIAALAACNKTEVVGVTESNAIAFDNAFVDNATKSVNDPSWSNTKLFSNFAVYGCVENATLFDNVEVTGSALNGNWTYTNTQYWIAGAKYNFAAVAPYANGETGVFSVTKNNENYVGTTTLPYTNVDGTNDLLYAQNAQVVGAATGNTKVAFTFRHILSKVKFSFENAYNASTATIKVYDIKIENAWKSATATLGVDATAWASYDEEITLDFGNASDNQATPDTQESVEVAYAFGETYESLNERLLIPGTAPKVTYEVKDGNTTKTETKNADKVTFKVDLLVNGTLIKTYPHTSYVEFTPVAGCSYDITAEINATNIDPDNTQEAIQFTVTTISDWDKTDSDKTM